MLLPVDEKEDRPIVKILPGRWIGYTCCFSLDGIDQVRLEIDTNLHVHCTSNLTGKHLCETQGTAIDDQTILLTAMGHAFHRTLYIAEGFLLCCADGPHPHLMGAYLRAQKTPAILHRNTKEHTCLGRRVEEQIPEKKSEKNDDLGEIKDTSEVA